MILLALVVAVWFLSSPDRIAQPARSAVGSGLRSGGRSGRAAAVKQWQSTAPDRATRLKARQDWLGAGKYRSKTLKPAHQLWRWVQGHGSRIAKSTAPLAWESGTAVVAGARSGWQSARDAHAAKRVDWFTDGLPEGWTGRVDRLGPIARAEAWRLGPDGQLQSKEVWGRWFAGRKDPHDRVRAWIGDTEQEATQYDPPPPGEGDTDPTGAPVYQRRPSSSSAPQSGGGGYGRNATLDVPDLPTLQAHLRDMAKIVAEAAVQLRPHAETSQHLAEALPFNPGDSMRGNLVALAESAPDPDRLAAWAEQVMAATKGADSLASQLEVLNTTGIQGQVSQFTGNTGNSGGGRIGGGVQSLIGAGAALAEQRRDAKAASGGKSGGKSEGAAPAAAPASAPASA